MAVMSFDSPAHKIFKKHDQYTLLSEDPDHLLGDILPKTDQGYPDF